MSKIPGTAFFFYVAIIYLKLELVLLDNVVLFPAIVDNLINRTLAWEEEKKIFFLYDGVSSSKFIARYILEMLLLLLILKLDVITCR